MSLNEIVALIKKKDSENQQLRNKIAEITENIKVIGRQNKKLKRKCERYQERLTEILYKGKIRNYSTCANNIEYPPVHTCDICTSLDQDEDYSMWKERI